MNTISYAQASHMVHAAACWLVEAYRKAAPDMARSLSVCGLAVQAHPAGVSFEPYDVEQGLDAMIARVKEDGILFVSELNQDTAIYPDHGGIDGNLWFRHVHDMGHLLYRLGFTAAEERLLHSQLWAAHVEPNLPAIPFVRELCRIVYDADTHGQTEHFEATGEFPVDQMRFAIAYLRGALSNA